MDEVLVERVLRAVELLPRGRVVSYGDLAALVGTGPRHVGNILREFGSGVAWWRVTNSYGDPPIHKRESAFEFWAQEDLPVKANGRGCRIREYRADLSELATRYANATAELPE